MKERSLVETDFSPQRAKQETPGFPPAHLQDLRACEERFVLAIYSSNDGWWDCDLRTDTVYFSPAWKRMLGYADDEIPNNFEEWLKRVHADDLESIVLTTLQQQKDGQHETYEFDHRLQHKDGSYRWIRARGSALCDDCHVVYRIAGWHTDITNQKQEEEKQTRRAQHAAFRVDVSEAVTERATLPMILQRCTEAMVHHLHAAFARIWTLTPGEDVLVLQASAGKYTHLNGPHSRIKLGNLKIGRIAQERCAHLTNDVLNDPHVNNKQWARIENMISFAGYPLVVEDQVVGVMALFSQEPLMEDTLDALATVAHAIAQGIGRKWVEEHLEERVKERTKELTLLVNENTRLSEQAQELAVLQERQRLARELHDSVSQTLYGIALGTRTARTLLHHAPDKLAELLDNVHSQAERGLTEMRTLIFELRPEELVTEGLVTALKKQVDAVETRYGLQIVIELGKEPALPFMAKEALYRIAQEALHNIVKHAHVNSARLQLSEGEDGAGVILEVSDAGVGFNPYQSFPGHLGLQSMRERLARLRGTLEITSAPGQGAQIRATVPLVTLRFD
jgi:PAS domain S-box-containing protein